MGLSKPLVVNELLAFIDFAKDNMDEVSILQICNSNFNVVEICSAKTLLYETLGKAAQMPFRWRDEKGEKCLQDIIDLLKETDPDEVPAFCGQHLRKLPTVTFDHRDVTGLLKENTSLKSSLAEMQLRLEASESTISELRAELLLSKSNNLVSSSPVASNINTRRGAQNVSVTSYKSEFEASPAAAVTHNTPRPASRSTAPVEKTSTSTPIRAYATVAKTPAVAVVDNTATANAVVVTLAALPRQRQSNRTQQKPDGVSTSAPNIVPPCVTKEQVDEEGFTQVQRRRRKRPTRNQCGTAPTEPNNRLRAAIPTIQLYVSRLFHSTTAEEVIDYVRVKTNITLRVVKLESRHDVNFASFVVRVPTQNLVTFMEPEFWPKGVVYRRFRGTIPSTLISRKTSQTQHVP